jgi:hypothetical protein
VLKKHHKAIMGDEFIADYISDLMKKLRCEVLLKLIQPYTNIRIPFIAKVTFLDSLRTAKRQYNGNLFLFVGTEYQGEGSGRVAC